MKQVKEIATLKDIERILKGSLRFSQDFWNKKSTESSGVGNSRTHEECYPSFSFL